MQYTAGHAPLKSFDSSIAALDFMKITPCLISTKVLGSWEFIPESSSNWLPIALWLEAKLNFA